MTSDITDRIQDIGSRTVYIAPYVDGMRPPRRPDASGEFPIITGTRPAGADELARLAAGETLVLPLDAAPMPRHAAAPTVYQPSTPTVRRPAPTDVRKPVMGRGRHRAPRSPWRLALYGAAALLVGELLAGLFTLAASAAVR